MYISAHFFQLEKSLLGFSNELLSQINKSKYLTSVLGSKGKMKTVVCFCMNIKKLRHIYQIVNIHFIFYSEIHEIPRLFNFFRYTNFDPGFEIDFNFDPQIFLFVFFFLLFLRQKCANFTTLVKNIDEKITLVVHMKELFLRRMLLESGGRYCMFSVNLSEGLSIFMTFSFKYHQENMTFLLDKKKMIPNRRIVITTFMSRSSA